MKTQINIKATALINPSGKITAFVDDYPEIVVQSPTLKEAEEKLKKIIKVFVPFFYNQSEIKMVTQDLV